MALRVVVDRPAAAECHGCSRRTVLQGLAVTAASMLVGCPAPEPEPEPPVPVDAAMGSPPAMCGSNLCIDLKDPANAALTRVDGSLTVSAPSDKILVMRTSDTAVKAVSDICTHAGCGVFYDEVGKLIECPCHGSRYSLTGAVLRGPAVRPLRSYTATLDAAAGIVTITV